MCAVFSPSCFYFGNSTFDVFPGSMYFTLKVINGSVDRGFLIVIAVTLITLVVAKTSYKTCPKSFLGTIILGSLVIIWLLLEGFATFFTFLVVIVLTLPFIYAVYIEVTGKFGFSAAPLVILFLSCVLSYATGRFAALEHLRLPSTQYRGKSKLIILANDHGDYLLNCDDKSSPFIEYWRENGEQCFEIHPSSNSSAFSAICKRSFY